MHLPNGLSLPLPLASFQVLPGTWSCPPTFSYLPDSWVGQGLGICTGGAPHTGAGSQICTQKNDPRETAHHGSPEWGRVNASSEIREGFSEEVTPESWSPSGNRLKGGAGVPVEGAALPRPALGRRGRFETPQGVCKKAESSKHPGTCWEGPPSSYPGRRGLHQKACRDPPAGCASVLGGARRGGGASRLSLPAGKRASRGPRNSRGASVSAAHGGFLSFSGPIRSFSGLTSPVSGVKAPAQMLRGAPRA